MEPQEARMATTITVKNIPADLYTQLKESAVRHHRSINSEIIAIIEKALVPQNANPDDFRVAAKALREKTRKYGLNQGFIERTKREGRP
jgi:plasmid stability protein